MSEEIKDLEEEKNLQNEENVQSSEDNISADGEIEKKSDENDADNNEKVEVVEEINWEEKCGNLEDDMLRLRAEQENFRKTMMKESEKKVNIALKNIVLKFLGVMNNFNQGMQAAETATDIASIVNGMKMVELTFSQALDESGVKEVPANIGEVFDPNFHQPISRIENDEHPENSILSVVAKGFLLKGMLIQPAMVTVATKPVIKEVAIEDGSDESNEENNGDETKASE